MFVLDCFKFLTLWFCLWVAIVFWTFFRYKIFLRPIIATKRSATTTKIFQNPLHHHICSISHTSRHHRSVFQESIVVQTHGGWQGCRQTSYKDMIKLRASLTMMRGSHVEQFVKENCTFQILSRWPILPQPHHCFFFHIWFRAW